MKDYTQSRIREFILDDHPCVMAQSVFADDTVQIQNYGKMDQDVTVVKLLDDLKKYVERQDHDSKNFESFIAVFKKDRFLEEKHFEDALWELLHKLWALNNVPWDEKTSSDPASNEFSFSLHGTSFYLVGMHPMASRFARKSPYTMIVFNLHNQFEKLREINRYTRVRDLIRRRDKEVQGSINPMLEDFGNSSEAMQYSGRAVSKAWKCPYQFEKS
ncbi:MAG: guanitoxin biosynthesis heme-dependent pre-guanitoxin N-hydroxylase GntA [Nonlabens sp.]